MKPRNEIQRVNTEEVRKYPYAATVNMFESSAEGQQRCKASLLSFCSACCSSAPICCLVKHEHYVCCDCITPAARPASLCSAAVWRFKDLRPGVKKHVYNPP